MIRVLFSFFWDIRFSWSRFFFAFMRPLAWIICESYLTFGIVPGERFAERAGT